MIPPAWRPCPPFREADADSLAPGAGHGLADGRPGFQQGRAPGLVPWNWLRPQAEVAPPCRAPPSSGEPPGRLGRAGEPADLKARRRSAGGHRQRDPRRIAVFDQLPDRYRAKSRRSPVIARLQHFRRAGLAGTTSRWACPSRCRQATSSASGAGFFTGLHVVERPPGSRTLRTWIHGIHAGARPIPADRRLANRRQHRIDHIDIVDQRARRWCIAGSN